MWRQKVVHGYVKKKIGEKKGGGNELMMFDSLGSLVCIYMGAIGVKLVIVTLPWLMTDEQSTADNFVA